MPLLIVCDLARWRTPSSHPRDHPRQSTARGTWQKTCPSDALSSFGEDADHLHLQTHAVQVATQRIVDDQYRPAAVVRLRRAVVIFVRWNDDIIGHGQLVQQAKSSAGGLLCSREVQILTNRIRNCNKRRHELCLSAAQRARTSTS